MRTLQVLILAVLFTAGCETPETETGAEAGVDSTTAELRQVWSLDEGLDRPESAIFDSERNVIYVSNIVGGPSEADGNGYISRVSPNGSMLEEQWVSGLDAPKGMAMVGETLYVSDIDELIAIDPETGQIMARYPAEAAEFLNDVAAGENGAVYVTDSGASKIYRLHGDSLNVWLDNPNVLAPNGIHMVDGRLVIAAADSVSEEPGGSRYLRTVSTNGTGVETLGSGEPLGALDAVEPDGRGGLFLSDWSGAKVMHFTRDDSVRTLVEVSQGTADLEYVPETQMMYLPVMMAGRLVAYEVMWGE